MLCALMKHIGKLKVNKAEPAWWSTCSADFDKILVRAWSSGIFSNGGRGRFMVSHRQSLSLFLGQNALACCAKALSDDAEDAPDKDALHVLVESQKGKVLFKSEGAKLELQEFAAAGEHGLKECEYHHFAVAEVEAFYKDMARGVDRLVASGHRAFTSRKQLTVDFLQVRLEVQTTGLQDQWSIPFAARAKQIALNTGSLERLPWEVKLFGEKILLEIFRRRSRFPTASTSSLKMPTRELQR